MGVRRRQTASDADQKHQIGASFLPPFPLSRLPPLTHLCWVRRRGQPGPRGLRPQEPHAQRHERALVVQEGGDAAPDTAARLVSSSGSSINTSGSRRSVGGVVRTRGGGGGSGSVVTVVGTVVDVIGGGGGGGIVVERAEHALVRPREERDLLFVLFFVFVVSTHTHALTRVFGLVSLVCACATPRPPWWRVGVRQSGRGEEGTRQADGP